MSDASAQETAGSGHAADNVAEWLCLAAAPAFAIMAGLSGVLDDGMSTMPCSAAQDVSPLSGMVPMYLLMSAFHLGPWLKLVSDRRSVPTRPDPPLVG